MARSLLKNQAKHGEYSMSTTAVAMPPVSSHAPLYNSLFVQVVAGLVLGIMTPRRRSDDRSRLLHRDSIVARGRDDDVDLLLHELGCDFRVVLPPSDARS
jgi:hypothetical protein